jgi:uncharacterized membrane protein YgdD (TMEM256/DUF423 family)
MRDFVLTDRAILAVAAAFAFIAVAAGAYGAHGAGDQGDVRVADLFNTASRYQMWHSLGTIACIAVRIRSRLVPLAFLSGIVLFSGSLYALALGAPREIAFITPFGGSLFLLGWAAFGKEVLSARRDAF